MKKTIGYVIVGAGLIGLPNLAVSALTLEIKTDRTTLAIEDNGPQDLSPQSEQIFYRGVVDKVSASPFEINLQVQAVTADGGYHLKVTSGADGGITNLGLAAPIQIAFRSGSVNLTAPVKIDLTYQGEWSDVTDGRQQIQITRHQWRLTDGQALVKQHNFDAVTSLGKTVPFSQNLTFQSTHNLPQVNSALRLALGAGDALTIQTLDMTVQGQANQINWLVVALGLVLATLLSFLWLRKRAARA